MTKSKSSSDNLVPPLDEGRRRAGVPSRRVAPPWIPIAIGVLAGVVVGALIGVIAARVLAPSGPGSVNFADVIEGCGVPAEFAVVGNNGATLTLNQKGGEDEDGATLDDVWCIARDLDTPSKIETRMRETTGNDGVLSDRWDGISVSWSYHPDAGLDVAWTKG